MKEEQMKSSEETILDISDMKGGKYSEKLHALYSAPNINKGCKGLNKCTA
jgi:hypothetical protein